MRFHAVCTIYDHDSLQRRVVEGVHWEDCEGFVRRTTGKTTQDSVVVYIPFASTGEAPKKGDYIVRGAVDVQAERLRDIPGAHTILSVDTRDYGSARLHHWEVAAK